MRLSKFQKFVLAGLPIWPAVLLSLHKLCYIDCVSYSLNQLFCFMSTYPCATLLRLLFHCNGTPSSCKCVMTFGQHLVLWVLFFVPFMPSQTCSHVSSPLLPRHTYMCCFFNQRLFCMAVPTS